ncbi:MAG: hypothetical protein ABI037_01210 [Gemmatimonadales bacterium]
MKYLASRGTAAELREMSGGGEEEEEAPAEDPAEDSQRQLRQLTLR